MKRFKKGTDMEYMDLKELSVAKKFCVGTLRRFLKKGMPHFRVGRKILVNPDEYDKWFRDNFRQVITAPSHDSPDDIGDLVRGALKKIGATC
jgi:hypothetical protein